MTATPGTTTPTPIRPRFTPRITEIAAKPIHLAVPAECIELEQTGDLEYYLVVRDPATGRAVAQLELDHVGTNRLADLLSQVNDR